MDIHVFSSKINHVKQICHVSINIVLTLKLEFYLYFSLIFQIFKINRKVRYRLLMPSIEWLHLPLHNNDESFSCSKLKFHQQTYNMTFSKNIMELWIIP